MKKPNKISVFEYDRLKTGCVYSGVEFTEPLLKSLAHFHTANKVKYFNLINNGVEFCEYVGVIQVDGVQIEVLPKLDRNGGDVNAWRDMLIGMLREAGMFRVSAPSSSLLTLRSNSILELYFDLFITEVEYLIRTGLVKQYRRQTLNQTALKGSLDFPGHLSRNIVHKERFYTKTNIYDYDHIWNSILRQAIDLIRVLSMNNDLHNRIGALNLNFPEITPVRISEQTFNNLIYTRKTESYRAAIEIAKLLLLGFHPNLSAGQNYVLALMFDMNMLWERFIYHSLRKQFLINSAPYTVTAQHSKKFWSTDSCSRYLKPDLFVKNVENGRRYVLDTKWKDISRDGPSPSDLQQLFAYSQFFCSAQNALVYPGLGDSVQSGRYAISRERTESPSCSLIRLGLESNIRQWQEAIYITITNWMNEAEVVF